MKKAEQQFELAKLAINRIIIVVGVLAVVWMIFAHNPTTFKAAFNTNEFTAEISCEFASDSPEE